MEGIYTDKIFRHAVKNGKKRLRLTFHHDPNDTSHVFFNVPGTRDWVVLYALGASPSARLPFEAERERILATMSTQRRQSKRQKDASKAALQRAVDQVVVQDASRMPSPVASQPAAGTEGSLIGDDALDDGLAAYEWETS